MEENQQIAKIRKTYLGFEDHGLLTASVDFDYGGGGQWIGHRAFGSSSEDGGEQWAEAHARGMDFVRRLLLACGVDQWEKLVGRTVLVTATWTEVQRIDPLPTERGESFDIIAWAADSVAA